MIVIDTSAAISLATANSLEIVLEQFDSHTTESVRQELENTAEYDDIHGTAAMAVLEHEEEYVVHLTNESTRYSSRIDQGEASCVTLAQELDADFLITDDFRALPELQHVTNSKVAISPLLLKALVKRGELENQQARERVEMVAENRDWLGFPIYRRAKRLFEE